MYQPNYYNPQQGYYPNPVELKHSGVGIASFIISLAVGLIELVTIVMATSLVMHHKRSDSPEMIVAGLGMLGGLALALLGVILAFVGLAQRSKKVFAILGLVFNGGVLLLVAALMVIGIMSK